MTYHLLVVDMDGTLVQKDGTVSYADQVALARLRSKGISISVATGRAMEACRLLLRCLSLDGFHIFYDGALVADPAIRQEIYAEPLVPQVLKEVIDFARRRGIYLELYSRDYLFVESIGWPSSIHYHFFGVAPVVVSFEDIWTRESILKAEMVVSNPLEANEAAAFSRHFKDRLRFSIARAPGYPGIDFVNVIGPDVSKGEALRTLIQYQGVKSSEVVAIGDGLNDASLFEVAGLTIAMGNAPPELKAKADFVTLDVGENGLAAAIDRLLL